MAWDSTVSWQSVVRAFLGGCARPLWLCLDYDGTLAPHVVRRDEAYPYDGVRERLNALNGLAAVRLPIISGRMVNEVNELLGLDDPVPIWGCHGLQRRFPDGRIEHQSVLPSAQHGLASAREWAKSYVKQCSDLGPKSFEGKYGCVVLHWRDVSKGRQSVIAEEVGVIFDQLAQGRPLDVLRSGFSIELRASVANKGSVIRQIHRESDGGSLVFGGDDQTDEDGFWAVNELGGLSVLFHPTGRKTQAKLWIRPEDELLSFLDLVQECI